jgi:hypothetical protein
MSVVYAFLCLLAGVAVGCWYGLKRLGPEPEEPTSMKKETQ